jgi:hypothetical protein
MNLYSSSCITAIAVKVLVSEETLKTVLGDQRLRGDVGEAMPGEEL